VCVHSTFSLSSVTTYLVPHVVNKPISNVSPSLDNQKHSHMSFIHSANIFLKKRKFIRTPVIKMRDTHVLLNTTFFIVTCSVSSNLIWGSSTGDWIEPGWKWARARFRPKGDQVGSEPLKGYIYSKLGCGSLFPPSSFACPNPSPPPLATSSS
jgi:hypothetical protein